MKFEFINKTLFFPDKGILAIGDMHLGSEHQTIQSGILTPKMETQTIIDELRDIIFKIKESNKKLKKVIFIGDVKHAFNFEYDEKISFYDVLEFLEQYIKKENLIFIKGNHDVIDFTGKMKDFHIEEDIAFTHGHEQFHQTFDKNIKTIVMGHIHPSIIFHDSHTSKKEKYKCFLVGSFKKKEIIVLPSFLGETSGQPLNNYGEMYEDDFSIIPKKHLMDFNVYAIGKDKVYEFKRLKDLLDA